jgi:hypothetical protein
MSDPRTEVLRNALKEVASVSFIIERGIEDYHYVQQLVVSNRIQVPSAYRPIVKRLFGVTSGPPIETPDDVHNWLSKHIVNSDQVANFETPSECTKDYDELFRYLIGKKSVVKVQKKQLLQHQLEWGYFLELFCQIHTCEYMEGKKIATLKSILHDTFQIDDSYARKLRWAGKTAYEYQKFIKLSLSLNQFVGKRKQIENMLKKRNDLAKKWKLETVTQQCKAK